VDTIGYDDKMIEAIESRSSANYMMRKLRERFGDESVDLLSSYFNMDNRSKSDIFVKAQSIKAKMNRDRYMMILYKKYKNDEI
jgi:ribonuclease HII